MRNLSSLLRPLGMVLGTLLVGFPATAEEPPWASGWAMAHDLPAGMNTTDTTRTISGDFTGDLRPDVFMLADGVVYVAFAPDSYAAVVQIPATVITTPVKDIAFLHLQSRAGKLLALTDNGLEVITLSGNVYSVEETVSSNGWLTALSLRTLDYGGNAKSDLVGISGDGLSLLRIKDFLGARVYDPALPVGSTIHEIEPLDWTGDGKDEIAVRLDTTVEIHDTSGPPVVLSPSEPPVQLQAVAFPSLADRLAVVAWISGGSDQTLHLYGNGLSPTEAFLGPVEITAIASGDTDGDGDGDLFMTNRTDYKMPYLINRYDTDPAQPFLVVPGSAFLYTASGLAATDNRAEPVLDDLDNDGDLDTAVVRGHDRDVLVQRNIATAEFPGWVQISDRPFDTITIEGSPHQLILTLLEPEVAIIRYDAIEVRVWRQADTSSPTVLDQFHTLPFEPGFESEPIFFDLYEEDTTLPFDAVYYFEFRTVETNAGGAVIAAGPTSFFFYTTDEDTWDELRDSGQGMPNYNGVWAGPQWMENQSWSGGTGPTPTPPPGAGDPESQES